MKANPILRLLAVSLMTGFLLASAPPVQATLVRDNSGSSFWEREKKKEKEKEKEKEREREKDRGRKTTQMPEGGGRVLLALAAGALGGSVLVWRRRRRADVA